jgi:hypothetical protein
MLRLVINNVDVQLYENAPVNLKFQYSDITAIQNPLGSYSQSFRIPLTRRNRSIFGNLDVPSQVNGINLQQRITASLLNDTIPILDGFVQVKSVIMHKEHFAEIEIVFFSGALDLKTELGAKMLSDLDLEEYNHDLQYGLVGLSWIRPPLGTAGDVAPEITYGLIDRGSNWSVDNPIGTDTQGMPLSRFCPFIQAKVLFDHIMDEAGFTYESTFIESDEFGDIYMPLYNGAPYTLPADTIANNLRVAADTSNQTISSGAYTRIQLWDNRQGCYDQGSNWLNSNDEYVVPFSGTYNITATFTGTSGLFFTCEVNLVHGSTSTSDFIVAASYNQTIVVENISLAAGDLIYLQARKIGSAAGAPIIFGSNTFDEDGRTTIDIEALQPFGGYEVGISQNMPEMKQIDYLTSLQKMFNLVFVPDGIRPNHLIVQTYPDFIASGQSLSIEDAIDYGSDVVIKPTTDTQPNEYEWTYSPGKDFISEQLQKTNDRTYGSRKILDPENDFATGELTIQNKFGPFILSLIPGTGNAIYRALTADGKGIQKPLPMLAYYNEVQAANPVYYVQDENNVTQSQNSIPIFSAFSSAPPGITDSSLYYGTEVPLHPISVQPRDTLYTRFWAQYVAELYSPEARILECTLQWNMQDIVSMRFNNKYYIQDAFYRLLSLSYDASEPNLAKATFLKVLSDLEVCEDIPTSISGGVILFNNSNSGNPDYGSQKCCEFYGYRWDINRQTGSRCRPNIQPIII